MFLHTSFSYTSKNHKLIKISMIFGIHYPDVDECLLSYGGGRYCQKSQTCVNEPGGVDCVAKKTVAILIGKCIFRIIHQCE